MKKLAVFLFLAAGLAFAQAPASQDPAQAPSAAPAASAQTDATQTSSAQQTDVGKPTDTNEQLFKGCVGGTKDNYTLTDDKGASYRLHSDKDLNEHVGNMVEIKGSVKKEGADRPAATEASAGAGASTAAAQQELDVADIKSVSKGCSTDANKSK